MKKRIKIVKKGKDEGNLDYWLSLSYEERMANLEKMRQEVSRKKYDKEPEFQKVYRILKRRSDR